MRIALVGDLQYNAGTEAEIKAYLSQIEAQKPDFAVSMGDMGKGGETGTIRGMETCRAFLDMLSCPKAVLLGNHDVEYMPENGKAPEQMQWYTQVFGKEHPWEAISIGNVLMLCVSVEQQPIEGHITRHCLYVSDAQFDWVREQLLAHRNKPVIICSHAPAPGSGLRCYPPIHVAAVDDYIDHTFDALRWRRLIEEFPNIRLWCSAHFHMGHDYLGAMCRENNLLHVSCGVITSAARDDTRMTRFLDVSDTEIKIYTLDHRKEEGLHPDAVVPLTGNGTMQGTILPRDRYDTFIGPDEAEQVYSCEALHRVFITTKKGFLWEYDTQLHDLVGAVVQERHVLEIAVEENALCWEDETGKWKTDLSDRLRFAIRAGDGPARHEHIAVLPEKRLPVMLFASETLSEGTYLRFEA